MAKARDDGTTPLFIAVQKGYREVAEALPHQGANLDRAGDGGTTPLYMAAQLGCTTMYGGRAAPRPNMTKPYMHNLSNLEWIYGRSRNC